MVVPAGAVGTVPNVLPTTPALAVPTPPPARRRRGVVVFIVVALVVAAGAAGAAAVTSARNGGRWEQRAAVADAQVDELWQANQKIADENADLRQLLGKSEEDVADLERRLTELANEKAQAQDGAAMAETSADAVYAIADVATDAARLLETCVRFQEQWAEILNRTDAGYVYNQADLDRFTSDMDGACQAAKGRFGELEETLSGR
jgi:chromosome segregation ATPase